jgi:ATP-dependent RNA helicase DDX54/DBP10
MNLDLRSVQYVVFDEADRLFEMGFETALTEIIHRLPASRQTVLFSATLPKSLVEFARAGLQNPKLVRLDADSKISSDLRMAFFSVKQDEKDAALLVLLRDIIGVPLHANNSTSEVDDSKPSKKDEQKTREQFAAPHQTLVFAATKHHVEYLTNLLSAAGFAVSHIYGALDHVARLQQMERFRRGQTNILVVTDVAARGIDIPILENVVNYDFPHGARVFIHRVGRTARAGRQGWAWSFVSNTELPYLLDLQLFLARPILCDATQERARNESTYVENLVLGSLIRETIDEEVEFVRSLDVVNNALPTLREVMRKGQGMYERSKGKASQASYKRAKDMTKEPAKWGLVSASSGSGFHPVLLHKGKHAAELVKRSGDDAKRKVLLQAVNGFRPSETVLELGAKGKTGNAELMKGRRKALRVAAERAAGPSMAVTAEDDDLDDPHSTNDMEMADEDEIEVRLYILYKIIGTLI